MPGFAWRKDLVQANWFLCMQDPMNSNIKLNTFNKMTVEQEEEQANKNTEFSFMLILGVHHHQRSHR